MTGIELYSTTAASNNSAVPNGFPESMAPSGVNDAARQMMASIRTWYETAEWINLGHTPTYIGATQFSVPTDLTATYQVGRRIKAVGSTPFTIYGTISASAYASVTTVTVTWDSGSLNGTLTAVSVGAASVTNPSIGTAAISGFSAPPFTDTNTLIKGSADATKLLRFEVDGFTTGTTRVLTPPNFDGTIATLAGTETFTNKTLTSPTITGGTLTTSTVNGVTLTTGGSASQYLNGAGSYASVSSGVFTQSFTSSDQTITAAGSLTLAHGLSATPYNLAFYLICQTGEAGYSAGDVVMTGLNSNIASDRGFSAWVDSTNVNIRYSTAVQTLQVPHKTTGVATALTNANWKLRVKAWA